MCFRPLDVTASGNSAKFLTLDKVTFFTSIKEFFVFFVTRKSNLVFSPNLTSCSILSKFLKSFIKLFFNASKIILFVKCVLIPTLDF